MMQRESRTGHGTERWGLYAMLALSAGHILVFAPRLFENTYFFDDLGWLVDWGPAPYFEVLQGTLHEHWHPVLNVLAKAAFNLGGADSRPFSSYNLLAALGGLWGLYALLRYFGASWYAAVFCLSVMAHNGILIPISVWPTCFLFMMMPMIPGIFAARQLYAGHEGRASGYVASWFLFTVAIYTGPCGMGFLPAVIVLGCSGRNLRAYGYVAAIVGSCAVFLYLRALLLVDLPDKVVTAANLLKFSPFHYFAVAGLDLLCIAIGWVTKLPAGYVMSRVNAVVGEGWLHFIGAVVGVLPLGIIMTLILKEWRKINLWDWIDAHRPLVIGALIFYSMNGLVYLGRLKAIRTGIIDLARQDYYHVAPMVGIALMLFATLRYISEHWTWLKSARLMLSLVGASLLLTFAANYVYWKYASEENFFGPSMVGTASTRRAFLQDLEHLVQVAGDGGSAAGVVLPDLLIGEGTFTPRYYGIKITERTLAALERAGEPQSLRDAVGALAGREYPFEKPLLSELRKAIQLSPRQRLLIIDNADNRSIAYSGLLGYRLSAYARGLVPGHSARFSVAGEDGGTIEVPAVAAAFYATYFGIGPHGR